MSIENRLEAIEKRLSLLEQDHGLNGECGAADWHSVIKVDLILPEAEIDGLRFNETKVHAVFELKEDGWWHSREILFLSARNTDDNNSRNILMEYLNSEPVQNAFLVGLDREDMNIEISLPKENRGIKNYNGVDWWYWLLPGYSAASFCDASSLGLANSNSASSVGGCAPAFRAA